MNTLYIILLPLLLFAGAILVILLDAFLKDSSRKSQALSIFVLLATLLSCLFVWPHQGSAFNGMIVLDSFSLVATFLFCLAGLITLLLLHDHPLSTAQFHSLLLLTLIGMILLVSGTNFLVLFIGLEILSLSIYVLAAFAKGDPLSAESGMKYFLLGSFASAFFLYGVAFIYGATGSIQLNAVAEAIAKPDFAKSAVSLSGNCFFDCWVRV